MKKVNIFYLLGVFFLLVVSTVWGERACVWEVEKDGKSLLIGGTCHCLSKTDYPLPAPYEKAYQVAKRLVFECDMDVLESPEMPARMYKAYRYPKGKTMKDYLSPEVYKDLERVCASNAVPLSFYVDSGYKPSLPLLSLSMMQLMKLKIKPEWGVDTRFHKRAKADGKPCGGLESVDLQIRLLSSLSDGIEDQFVQYSLKDIESTNTQFMQIVQAWKVADTQLLAELIHSQLGVQFAPIYQRLIVDRNRSWVPVIEGLLKTPEVEFVLVGTGHLVGKENVLQLLAEKGYTIRFFEVKTGAH